MENFEVVEVYNDILRFKGEVQALLDKGYNVINSCSCVDGDNNVMYNAFLILRSNETA